VAIWFAVCFRSFSETSADLALPPIETVLQRVVARAQSEIDNDCAFKQRYFYTWTKVTEFRDGDGDLKKSEKKQGANDPARNTARLVSHPPAAQPGVSLSTGGAQGPSATKSNVRGRAFDKNEFLTNPDLLKRFAFVLKGRESVNGRDTFVVDFKPKPGKLPERNLKDRFINRAGGRIWLDEADSQLVKVDLHLTEKVDVLGGLVGSIWTFNYAFERERTGDGLWFTRATRWHLEGREVFLRRTVDYREQAADLNRIR
jgi:hypothetical protein